LQLLFTVVLLEIRWLALRGTDLLTASRLHVDVAPKVGALFQHHPGSHGIAFDSTRLAYNYLLVAIEVAVDLALYEDCLAVNVGLDAALGADGYGVLLKGDLAIDLAFDEHIFFT
jgi:hypothetical protein